MQSMAGEFPFFPEKIRVLVVDDNPVCGKIISRMLNHCNYQVTEVAKATDAVETLTKNPKGFDMVITDTRNDIEILSLLVKIMKMESIPVILVSGLEDTSTLIKGVLQGADEVLLKPVSLSKIKNLWQHVYRRKLIERQPHSDPSPDSGGGDQPACPSSSKNEALNDDAGEEEEVEVEHKRSKRMRVKWQGTLQEKFTEAVLQLGGPEKAVPKKIMEMINAPDISRESVASHLQKYRKQKKPLVAHQNDTNSVVSSSLGPVPLIIRAPVSHPNCFNKPMAHRFGYHHHHNHGFPYRRLGNSHHFNTATVPFPSRSPSLWHVPKAEPQLGSPFSGQLPDQQQPMLPPLPRCMTPHPIQNNTSASTIPPASSVATDHNNYNSFSTYLEEPWIDTSSSSSVFDDTLLICEMLERDDDFGPIFGFQPEDDQWMSALVGEQSSDNHQLKIAGDGADGASN